MIPQAHSITHHVQGVASVSYGSCQYQTLVRLLSSAKSFSSAPLTGSVVRIESHQSGEAVDAGDENTGRSYVSKSMVGF